MLSSVTRKSIKLERSGRALPLLAFVLAFLAGCNEAQQKPRPPQQSAAPESVAAPLPETVPPPPAIQPQEAVQPAQIESPTFVADVLPILNASSPGRVHRCTVCHANYGIYESVAKTEVVRVIIDSLEAGRMPLNGDRLKDEEIKTIKAWLAAKMPNN